MNLWKKQKSLKTAELEFLIVSIKKLPLLQPAVSVTDSMLNLPIFFHNIEKNKESKNMNEIMYCETDFPPPRTKKS